MIREGELAGGNGLQQSRLSATVLTQETITTPVVDLDGGVVEENAPVEHQRSGGDLDITGSLERGKHTGGDTIGQTVLVLLQLELQKLLLGRGHLLVSAGGLSSGGSSGLGCDLLHGLASVLGLALCL